MDMRVLVMGLGFFGKNWLKEVLACTECEVAGIVAKHPELLATVGEAFTVAPSKRFTTIEEGLDRSQAQAVIVALPEMVHKRAILAALHRGLHVLTEKPLAMDMTEAAEVVRAARRAQGAILMVDQNYRWRPQTRALRRAIREGRIGRVASASYEFRQSILRPTTDAWREEMPHPYLHDIAERELHGHHGGAGVHHAAGRPHHHHGRGRDAAAGGGRAGPLVPGHPGGGGPARGDALHRHRLCAAGISGGHPGGAAPRDRRGGQRPVAGHGGGGRHVGGEAPAGRRGPLGGGGSRRIAWGMTNFQ
ncbi:MAG: Gfo/Idh/MocA family oxidoreductase [candidate division NC10 bacterium]|nr:Gfo/Idh/MocA family oxidoreductase [candidate division NC10 bacterium]